MEAHGVNNPDAEMVASKLLGFLIKAFIDKTGHEPNAEEVEQLLEEMTPERVAELLGEEVDNSAGETVATSTGQECSSDGEDEFVGAGEEKNEEEQKI